MSLIECTPNLKYLNVQIRSFYRLQKATNKININLKEFNLKLNIPCYLSAGFDQDHNWSFEMYGDYLFTLPFHFNDVQSNNNEL